MSPGTWVRKAGVQLCPGSLLSPKFSWRNCLQGGRNCPKCCILDEAAHLVCVILVQRHNQAGTMIQCLTHTLSTSAPRRLVSWAEPSQLFPSPLPCLGWAETSPWALVSCQLCLWCLLQFLGGEAALNSRWITIFLWLMAQGPCPGEDRAVMNLSDSLSHLSELQRLNKFFSHDGIYPNDSRLLMFSICLFELAF